MTCQAACEHLIGLLYRRIARKVGHCEPGSLGGGSTDLLVTSLVPNAEIFSEQRRKNENKLSSVQNPAGGDASQICSGPVVRRQGFLLINSSHYRALGQSIRCPNTWQRMPYFCIKLSFSFIY